jgi:hypothetical protein
MKSTQRSELASALAARIPAVQSFFVALCALAAILLTAGLSSASPRTVVLASGVVSIITVAILVWILARSKQLKDHIGYLMLMAGLLYWYALPALTLALDTTRYIGERHSVHVTPNALTRTSIYVVLYLTAAVWTYWLLLPTLSRWEQKQATQTVSVWFYLGIFALFLAGFVPYLIHGGGIQNIIKELLTGRANSHPWRAEGALGDHRSVVYYICISGFVAASSMAGTWALFSPHPMFRRSFAGMFLFAGLILFLDGGTRSWVALAWVPTILVWIASTLRSRMSLERILVTVVVLVSLQLVFEIARGSRNTGWSLKTIKKMDFSEIHFDNEFFTDAAVSSEIVPKRHPYFGLGEAYFFATHPVPRFLWKNKPVPPALMYYNEVVHAGLLSKQGNKLPSHIGQAHMSLGTLGVILLGLLGGAISVFSSVWIGSKNICRCHIGSVAAVWWLLMGRGIYPGWTYPLIFAFILVALGLRRVYPRNVPKIALTPVPGSSVPSSISG